MKRLLYIFAVFAALCACSDTKPEWQAALAAQKYYTFLAEGSATRFLEGKAGIDSLPDDYCEQLLKAVEQYHAEIQQKHGGLRQILISDNTLSGSDTLGTLPYVKAFLILCYNDTTQEEIVVPMVQENGTWRMK